jgi:hypothetical protein
MLFASSCRESQPPKDVIKCLVSGVMSMLAASWNAVSQETIENCYWKPDFVKHQKLSVEMMMNEM